MSTEALFENPLWSALTGEQQRFATRHGQAARFPAEVLRFSAVEDNTPAALHGLAALLAPGERTYLFVTGAPPAAIPELNVEGVLSGLQMIGPEGNLPSAPESQQPRIRELGLHDVPSMLELIAKAFPGYFFRRTIELGSYYGIWSDGELVAMAGERLRFDRYVEISALCTHPAHTGKGYAAALIAHLMHAHRGAGRRSFLHLAASNERARALYERLGFSVIRRVDFTRLVRRD